MVAMDKRSVADEVIMGQFGLFGQRIVFTSTDEELDEAARVLGCRSAADMRTVALLTLFMHSIERNARWN